MFEVSLSHEQAEEVTREFLIDLLEDLNVPFTDPVMLQNINQLVSWMSPPGSWKDGKYDE